MIIDRPRKTRAHNPVVERPRPDRGSEPKIVATCPRSGKANPRLFADWVYPRILGVAIPAGVLGPIVRLGLRPSLQGSRFEGSDDIAGENLRDCREKAV